MSVIFWPAAAAALGFLLDLIFGDPHWLYHPVRAIGAWITVCEKVLRRIFPRTKRGERAAGVFLVILVLAVSIAVPLAVLMLLYRYFPIIGFAVETFWCYQLIATKSLRVESGKVYRELKEGTLESSRKAVSMIVGRDPDRLDRDGVARAAVETVAESTSDGVIAPLFYMMIGGAVWGFAYKAVNTMDSMVGYKNERYRYFGTAAARLDDAANFLPSRIAALLMICASCLAGFDGKNAARIWKRDRRKHASPNAAQTESAMAGALHLCLAGDAWYEGKLEKKPFIGDGDRPVEAEDIRRSQRISYGTAGLGLLVFGAVRIGISLVVWIL